MTKKKAKQYKVGKIRFTKSACPNLCKDCWEESSNMIIADHYVGDSRVKIYLPLGTDRCLRHAKLLVDKFNKALQDYNNDKKNS